MPPELRALGQFTCPRFGRAADWVGAWAIEPTAGHALLEVVRRTDLARHVAEAQPAPKSGPSGPPTIKAGGVQVAVVMLTGPLQKAVGSMSEGTSTVQARSDLRKAANDPDVGAILLAIDSPGGTVAGTMELAAEVRAAAAKKPVYAFADDLCASAAYWVGSQAEKFYANNPTALVGSIGTLMVVYDLSQAAEDQGIKALVFGTGPLKGTGAPGAPITEAQQEYLRGIVEDAQKSFDAGVQKARGLTDKQLAAAKTGGVFGAAEALDRKLIDGIKGFDAVVTELAAEARRRQRQSGAGASAPAPQRSATVNEFDTFVTASGFDPAAITEPERAVLQTAFAARPKPAAPAAQPAVPDPVAAQNALAAANAERIAGVQRVCADHPAIAAQAIRENWSVERAENAALKAGLANTVRPFNPAILDSSQGRAKTAEGLQAALLLRAGCRLDHPAFQTEGAYALHLAEWMQAGLNTDRRQRAMEYGHRLSHMSLFDLARECVRLDGRDAPYERPELLKAAFSGGTLTNIFTTNVNAVLLASYTEFSDTTAGWTSTTDVPDFKLNERPRVQVMGGMTKLTRGGEADHNSRADVMEQYKIARYASQIQIDEQDFVDDRLNALAETPRDMGRVSARLRPDIVYAILLANTNLAATGRALFNGTDGNLKTTNPLASAGLKAATSAMGLVTENAVTLNLMPTHLIVPWSLRYTGRELLGSTQIIIAGTAGTVTERGNANTLADDGLTLVADARIENGVKDPDSGTTFAGSSTNWYLASTQAKTIEVAFLRGTGRAPQTRAFILDKGRWGMGWDINLDIGAKALDWRGLQKSTP